MLVEYIVYSLTAVPAFFHHFKVSDRAAALFQ